MSGVVRRAAAGALAVAAAFAIAAASRVPYPVDEPEHALLRLSWRALSAQVRECRQLSVEEIANRPVHMRRTEVCEGRVLPYRLEVALDDRALVHETVAPAGARGDRPLYVLREIPVTPGVHRLTVRFAREDAERTEDAAAAPHHGDARATPARLELDATVELARGAVLLVTYDPEGRALVARAPDRGARR